MMGSGVRIPLAAPATISRFIPKYFNDLTARVRNPQVQLAGTDALGPHSLGEQSPFLRLAGVVANWLCLPPYWLPAMTAVTRRALRVYAALSELRQINEDVLDALIPFFEPVLQLMNGKIFDPKLFIAGVLRLYRWRFTGDIVEQFIPRLARKGYLVRSGTLKEAIYTVRFNQQPAATEILPINQVLDAIVDEFIEFPPRVTDLLAYHRTREELAESLIRFLVSLDAYGEAAFVQEIQRLQLGLAEQSALAQLEEEGTPLGSEDLYMFARFVQHLCTTRPDYLPHLVRLASIGLLTEVVQDFAKPIQRPGRVNLTIAMDAPVALDFVGCSGKALQ